MHFVLLLIGALTAVAGMAMIRNGVPVEDVVGAALFISGTVSVVGGLIVVSIAIAVWKLSRMAERLEIQPLPLPPIAAVGRDDPAPRPARPAPPPAPVAPARFLGWFGRGSAPAVKNGSASVARAAAPAAEPAVDLAPLAKIPEEPRPPLPAAALTIPASPPPPKPATPVRPVGKPAATNGATPETTVYKSGVIDGMAYSLFMDGSIEAELPQGRVKFPSVDELQKYLTTKTA